MNVRISRRILARVVATKLLEEPKERKHWVQALAAYLVEAHRENEVDLIVNDIAHELFSQKGELLVDVTSARPLGEQVRSELKDMLKAATKAKHVELDEHVDPELVGGLIARTPDAQLDLSVRSKLKALATIR